MATGGTAPEEDPDAMDAEVARLLLGCRRGSSARVAVEAVLRREEAGAEGLPRERFIGAGLVCAIWAWLSRSAHAHHQLTGETVCNAIDWAV